MKVSGFFVLSLFMMSVSSAYPAESDSVLILSDAEKFADLFKKTGDKPDPEQLQLNYLTPGSDGIRIFTPHRIRDADNLARQIAKDHSAYKNAISVCLPIVRSLSDESELIMREVAELVGEKEIAPAYVLFGANNSGGTASSEGLVIGIEVLCSLVPDENEFSLLFKDFIAHEIVHVYQNRLVKIEGELSLLDKVIVEGVADFIAEKVLGRVSSAAVERTNYGLKHEAALWHEFKVDIDSTKTGSWMYQQNAAHDRPADLGYWIGKRIAEAYYNKSPDKALALRELISFSDSHELLRKSHYGENF